MKHAMLFMLLCLCFPFRTLQATELPIIPQPTHVEMLQGSYSLSEIATLRTIGLSDSVTRKFVNYLYSSGLKLSGNAKNSSAVVELLLRQDGTPAESYKLSIFSHKIAIEASSESGLFYGIQSLLQLINNAHEAMIPAMVIKDAPRFGYRGMHLDVSRHFFPIEFIKKQLDMMAYLKLNTFHWHFTDGPGWRLEIKEYPLLTEVAAWRTHKTWKDWWASKRQYANHQSIVAYGGFYTQKQAKEIVAYAAERHITVIPEIEMPGHSEEVLAVYPQLACSGKPYTQSEFCVGNEETFQFLENVLTEVIDIFPSEYIHIGGDEADKRHWKECPKCQKRMQEEGLKEADELQSYLIKRIEKFLIANNRKLLGWDEIVEGGLAPEATVMSWRGEAGGVKSVKSGHDAIMTPGSHCYLDAYQANPATQPEAIGGFLPLEKVYSYNPIPKGLTETEAKHILGTQANLWTEYIPTQQHAEYMLYPRLLALAEVAWTKPENKSWIDFRRRANQMIPFLTERGYNTFTLSDEVAFQHELDSLQKAIKIWLTTEKHAMDIRYTLNGDMPDKKSCIYHSPILITDSAIVTAQLFKNNEPIGKPISNRFDYHLGIGKKVLYNIPINKYYPANGSSTLIDGQKGGLSHGDGRWQGFMTDGMDVTIDFGTITPIHLVQARFMQSIGPWIYFPAEVVISTSDDNVHFTELKRIPTSIDKKASGTIFQTFGWQGSSKGRYVRYQAIPNDIKGGWVFLDEIIVW